MSEIIEKELSYKIQGAVMDVYNQLGPGFREESYRQALIKELQSREIAFETEKTISVIYKGQEVDTYRLDLLVEGKVIVELKAVGEMHSRFKAQLLSYLKAANLKLGILVNFGDAQLLTKRLVNPHI